MRRKIVVFLFLSPGHHDRHYGGLWARADQQADGDAGSRGQADSRTGNASCPNNRKKGDPRGHQTMGATARYDH